jgi:hypothetical protein
MTTTAHRPDAADAREREAAARAATERATGVRLLGPDQVDDLARAVLMLAREVWVLRDRQRILETVLAERGIDVVEAVERHQPGPELQQKLDAERREFVRGLLRTLAPDAGA